MSHLYCHGCSQVHPPSPKHHHIPSTSTQPMALQHQTAIGPRFTSPSPTPHQRHPHILTFFPFPSPTPNRITNLRPPSLQSPSAPPLAVAIFICALSPNPPRGPFRLFLSSKPPKTEQWRPQMVSRTPSLTQHHPLHSSTLFAAIYHRNSLCFMHLLLFSITVPGSITNITSSLCLPNESSKKLTSTLLQPYRHRYPPPSKRPIAVNASS